MGDAFDPEGPHQKTEGAAAVLKSSMIGDCLYFHCSGKLMFFSRPDGRFDTLKCLIDNLDPSLLGDMILRRTDVALDSSAGFAGTVENLEKNLFYFK